jgi:mRNA interferase RelE/StbE
VTYRIEFRPAALRDLKSLPRDILDRVSRKISALAENPRPSGAEKLSGSEEDCYRIRVGDYRILYAIQDKVSLIIIIRVRHRREVYRG